MGKRTTKTKPTPPKAKAAPRSAKRPPPPPKKKIVKKSVPKKVVNSKSHVRPAPAPKKKAVRKAPPKAIKSSPKPKAEKPSGPKGYTSDEYNKYKDFVKLYSGKGNQFLKDLLRKNMQSMSGNKDELVYKCADGATLGRIPRCPKCFGGRYFCFNSDLNMTIRLEHISVQDTEMILTSLTAKVLSKKVSSREMHGTADFYSFYFQF